MDKKEVAVAVGAVAIIAGLAAGGYVAYRNRQHIAHAAANLADAVKAQDNAVQVKLGRLQVAINEVEDWAKEGLNELKAKIT